MDKTILICILFSQTSATSESFAVLILKWIMRENQARPSSIEAEPNLVGDDGEVAKKIRHLD